MHSSLKPKWLDSEVSHPKLSLVQTFLKSWNNRWYLLDKIPGKGSILSSYKSNLSVLWETKGSVLTEWISALPLFLLLMNKGKLVGDRKVVLEKE